MYLIYASLLLTLFIMVYLIYLIFRVTKKQCLKRLHLEINKGIKFDSEFYNGSQSRKSHIQK